MVKRTPPPETATSLSPLGVFRYVAQHWFRRPCAITVAVLLLAGGASFELLIPAATRHLINVISKRPIDVISGWHSWALFSMAFFGSAIARNIAIRTWFGPHTLTMKDIMAGGFSKIQSFSTDWHASQFSGTLVRQLSRGMWGYDAAGDTIVLFLLPAFCVLTGLNIQLFIYDPAVGIYSVSIAAFYILLNFVLSNFYIQPANARSVELDSELSGALADAISSNSIVRAFAGEAREEAHVNALLHRWAKAILTTWHRNADLLTLHDILLCLLQLGLTGFVVWKWSLGDGNAGQVVFAITSFLVMSSYIRNVGDHIRAAQRALNDIEDVARYGAMTPRIRDLPDAKRLQTHGGEITFDQVTFSYSGASSPVYDRLSLEVARGERVAIVGPTGSGKSTIVKLLHRLYEIEAGKILIDGQDIRQVTQESLRRAIAIVQQDAPLFHRTIAENISYARPEATRDEIIDAAIKADAHSFIKQLPSGYDTLVGERGVKLSGGERQRVAIARAFIAESPILIFDEASSSLDVHTEAAVQVAIEALAKDRTVIIIAHRLSTVERADRILVLNDGKILEQGTHSDLLAARGFYARLRAAGAAGGQAKLVQGVVEGECLPASIA